jgi:hypothetical protein
MIFLSGKKINVVPDVGMNFGHAEPANAGHMMVLFFSMHIGRAFCTIRAIPGSNSLN